MNVAHRQSLGFNGRWLKASQPVSLRAEDLVGPPLASQSCPYQALPPIAQEAFLELRRNTATPDAVIFTWMLSFMAASAMRKARVKAPGRDDDILSLFFITASASGTGKSPVYERLARPFKDYDIAASTKCGQLVSDHEEDLEAWKAMKKGLSDILIKATKRAGQECDESVQEAEKRLKAHVRRKPAEPRSRRILKTDASTARILQALEGESESMLLSTDEGLTLLKGIIKDGPDLFNKIFDGSTIVHERNHRNTVINRPLATFGLGTQPKRLIPFLKAHGTEAVESGFLPRCLIAVEWDDGDERDAVDDPQWHRLSAFNEIVAKHLRDADCTEGDYPFGPMVLTFTPEATEAFKHCKKELKDLRQPGAALHDIKPFARKAPQIIARVAAIFALFSDDNTSNITVGTLHSAIEVVAWHLGQVKEIFVDRPVREDMRKLIKRLEACYQDHRHFDYARVKDARWIPKTYLERFLHMNVDTLDPLLKILTDRGILTVQPHGSGTVYVQLREQAFQKTVN